jgi:hypothetical protein
LKENVGYKAYVSHNRLYEHELEGKAFALSSVTWTGVVIAKHNSGNQNANDEWNVDDKHHKLSYSTLHIGRNVLGYWRETSLLRS